MTACKSSMISTSGAGSTPPCWTPANHLKRLMKSAGFSAQRSAQMGSERLAPSTRIPNRPDPDADPSPPRGVCPGVLKACSVASFLCFWSWLYFGIPKSINFASLFSATEKDCPKTANTTLPGSQNPPTPIDPHPSFERVCGLGRPGPWGGPLSKNIDS